MLILIFGFTFVLSVQAETPSPSIADATPAEIGPTGSPQAPGTTAAPETAAGNSAAPGTYYNKGDGDLFDGTPDGTGNSAGEIVFMLVIFLFCLFFVVEAVVHWIRKKR